MNNFKITLQSNQYLDRVESLWRKNASTLGFFTKGAFREYSSKKQIIVAINGLGELAGYLLFRLSNNIATIVHLCINNKHRGHGLPKRLIDTLKENVAETRGIFLKCRRDYNLSDFWSKLGFVYRTEVVGRGKDSAILSCWWMELDNPNLFSTVENEFKNNKMCVVIDANVFYGIYSDERDDEEAKSLVADWLPDNIELCLTDEILNEIQRNDNKEERLHSLKLTNSYTYIPYNRKKAEILEKEISKIIHGPETESRRSDIRHLAKAISGDVLYFITRDRNILKYADVIYKNYQISIYQPYEFIIYLDQIERGSEYQPARLSGTVHAIRLMNPDDVPDAVDKFVCRLKNEKSRVFKKKIEAELAHPKNSSFYVLDSPDGKKALLVTREVDISRMEVPLFRISGSPLSMTLGHHLLRKIITEAVQSRKLFISITDQYINIELAAVISQDGFFKIDNTWIKVSIHGAYSLASLGRFIEELIRIAPGNSQMLSLLAEKGKNVALYNNNDGLILERILWPVKIIDLDVPTYIIPIKPEWAERLFDVDMADQSLFHIENRILQHELCYFRAKHPGNIKPYGRILWYVSNKNGIYGSGSLRAISYIEKVEIGKPKNLFREYRRLGVYDWEDVLRAADNNLNKDIMAIKFSDSHMLEKPMEWRRLKSILIEFNIKTTLQSPLRIDWKVFSTLYKNTLSANEII